MSAASDPLCASLTGRLASTAGLDDAFRPHVHVTAHGLYRMAAPPCAYSAFQLAETQVCARAGTGQNKLLDDLSLEKMLLEVCGDGYEC